MKLMKMFSSAMRFKRQYHHEIDEIFMELQSYNNAPFDSEALSTSGVNCQGPAINTEAGGARKQYCTTVQFRI
jgi:hypothetical protein